MLKIYRLRLFPEDLFHKFHCLKLVSGNESLTFDCCKNCWWGFIAGNWLLEIIMSFHDLLMTFSWLLMIFSGLFMTFSYLSQDFLSIISLLVHRVFYDFLMTFSWLSHDFLISFSWAFHDFLRTFLLLFHDFLMSFSNRLTYWLTYWMHLTWQSATVLKVCNCLIWPWFVLYRPLLGFMKSPPRRM